MKHNRNSHYAGSIKETVDWVNKNEQPNDIILTLGAGDVFYIHKYLIKK